MLNVLNLNAPSLNLAGLNSLNLSPLNLFDSIPDIALQIAVIVIGAVVMRWIVAVAIRRVVAMSTAQRERAAARQGLTTRVTEGLSRAGGWRRDRYEQRTRTIASLLGSISSVVILTISALMIMSLVGLPLTPLLASAGVGGVAIGFGAQSLVKDFISGVFLIFEDQFGVGDQVTVGSVTGVIEDITLRITRIRDADGVVWYVRNGDIALVGNRTQGGAADTSLPADADPASADAD